MTRLLSVALGIALICGTSASARVVAAFAAPRIIMFHGGSLDSPRYLTDWSENMDFMQALGGAVPSPSVWKNRPYLEVALFWGGPTWERYAIDAALLKTLKPEQTGHRGRLYLVRGAETPVFDYISAPGGEAGPRSLSTAAQEILTRRGVPWQDRR